MTAQEKRVLALLAADRTYRQIGEELVVSINTVCTHVKSIYRKLNVKRRVQAVAVTQRRRLLA